MDKDTLDIDLSRLDQEWVNQPKLYFENATELAEMRRDLELIKSRLDVVKADVDKKIRENPERFVSKTTETMIANAVVLHPDYRNVQESFREAKYGVDIAQAAVNALDHRKSALERLVSLHGQNYFSTPVATDEASKVVAEDMENREVKRRRQKSEKAKKKKIEADEDF